MQNQGNFSSNQLWHQAIRFYLLRELEQVCIQSTSQLDRNAETILRECIRHIEEYSPDKFPCTCIEEAKNILSSMVSSLTEYFSNQTIIEIDREVREKILTSTIVTIVHNLKENTAAPPTPYRRVLTAKEHTGIWSRFEKELKNEISYDLEIKNKEKLAALLKEKGKMLYYINPIFYKHSYILSSEWFIQLFEGNGYYWMDTEFNWGIYAEENGYYIYYGNLPPEILYNY